MKRIWQRNIASLAAFICALSVAMSAYASHGLEAQAQDQLLLASYFAFAHGLSLIVLVRLSAVRANLVACSLMLIGLFLFCGSLASAALWQTSTALAPAGGLALILAWCLVSANFLTLKDE